MATLTLVWEYRDYITWPQFSAARNGDLSTLCRNSPVYRSSFFQVNRMRSSHQSTCVNCIPPPKSPLEKVLPSLPDWLQSGNRGPPGCIMILVFSLDILRRLGVLCRNMFTTLHDGGEGSWEMGRRKKLLRRCVHLFRIMAFVWTA